MRVGEKIFVLREAAFCDEIFVTAREKDRLVDYQRFPRRSYDRCAALEALRVRFPVAKLDWSEERDEEFLRQVESIRTNKVVGL